MSKFFLWISGVISTDFSRKAKKTNKVQLINISVSHFCEIASWVLRYYKIPYEEHNFSPFEHIFPVLSVRKGMKENSLSSSKFEKADVLLSNSNDKVAKQSLGSKTSVPVAVFPDGSVGTSTSSSLEDAFTYLHVSLAPYRT
jgi:hypothetical protein